MRATVACVGWGMDMMVLRSIMSGKLIFLPLPALAAGADTGAHYKVMMPVMDALIF